MDQGHGDVVSFISACDECIRAFLEEESDSKALKHIEKLFERHKWESSFKILVRSELHYLAGLSQKERDDEVQSVLDMAEVSIRNRLRKLRSEVRNAIEVPGYQITASPLETFDPYAFAVIKNECVRRLHQLYPERARLKKRIEDAARQPYFDMLYWEQGPRRDLTRCIDLRGQHRPAGSGEPFRLTSGERRFHEQAAQIVSHYGKQPRLNTSAMLKDLLSAVQRPLILEEVVDLCLEQWDIAVVHRTESLDLLEIEPALAEPVKPFHRWADLSTYWTSLQLLNSRDRRLLLLSVEDLELFLINRVVSHQELADALGVMLEELPGILGRLPLPDVEIAQALGLRVDSVPVLRHRIRGRLKRLESDSPSGQG